jgi:hypothetical protein
MGGRCDNVGRVFPLGTELATVDVAVGLAGNRTLVAGVFPLKVDRELGGPLARYFGRSVE